jgi:hypothetical protein
MRARHPGAPYRREAAIAPGAIETVETSHKRAKHRADRWRLDASRHALHEAGRRQTAIGGQHGADGHIDANPYHEAVDPVRANAIALEKDACKFMPRQKDVVRPFEGHGCGCPEEQFGCLRNGDRARETELRHLARSAGRP